LPVSPSPLIGLAPRRVAVFRALYLGDMLCCVPALRSLRSALPETQITLISLPWAGDFSKRFCDLIDDFIPFPGGEAFGDFSSSEANDAFFAEMASRQFDLAIQLHGRGDRSNDVVRRFGARFEAGFAPGHSDSPWFFPYPDQGHEISRLLSLMRYIGADAVSSDLEFPISDEDSIRAAELLNALALETGRYIVVHPGAKLASRRWGVERFAAVARALLDEGFPVLITGTTDEARLTAAVREQAPPAFDIAGRTDLGTLAALIGKASLLISNDTGVSHIASALGTRSVVIASGSDVERWAPLDRLRHQTLFADAPCRPCDFKECPYEGHPCAQDVTVDSVVDAALAQLGRPVQ
jgi:ADP-heptose:LPS heptosyltransferase